MRKKRVKELKKEALGVCIRAGIMETTTYKDIHGTIRTTGPGKFKDDLKKKYRLERSAEKKKLKKDKEKK